MIYDCFTFFNENDVLAMRLEELYPVVDRFIIVQADETFRGKPKEDYYDYKRFDALDVDHKIRLRTLHGLRGNTTWEREIYQRNSIKDALASQGLQGADTVIISDVDEIPRRSVVEPTVGHKRLRLDKFSTAINLLTDEGNTAVRMVSAPYLLKYTCEQLRRSDDGEMIEDAGWEFSSLSDAAGVLKKFHSFAHHEFDDVISEKIFADRMALGVDILGRSITQTQVEIDDTFPEAIKNNRDYWRKYEWVEPKTLG